MNWPKGGMWRIACLAGLAAVVIFFLTVGREPLNHFLDQLRQWGAVPFYALFALCISFGMAFTTIGLPGSLPRARLLSATQRYHSWFEAIQLLCTTRK